MHTVFSVLNKQNLTFLQGEKLENLENRRQGERESSSTQNMDTVGQ
jgi:hypothetical protein